MAKVWRRSAKDVIVVMRGVRRLHDFVRPPPRSSLPVGVQTKLTDYPVAVLVPMIWGYHDAFGHVNNVHYARFMENARMDFMQQARKHMSSEQWDGLINAKTEGVILATTSIAYKYPVKYPDALSVGVRISEWKDDRFNFQYKMVSHAADRVAAEGDGWIVTYDYRLNKKVPIPRHIRHAFETINQTRHPLPTN